MEVFNGVDEREGQAVGGGGRVGKGRGLEYKSGWVGSGGARVRVYHYYFTSDCKLIKRSN